MKKIPTLFERVYEGHKIVDILPNITPGCEEAFLSRWYIRSRRSAF